MTILVLENSGLNVVKIIQNVIVTMHGTKKESNEFDNP